MKRSFVILLITTVGIVNLWGQKLEVRSLSVDLKDPAATQYAVKDFNGQNCALIIVGLAVDGVQFEGNIIKQERKENDEYWVYITEGSMDFQINAKGYLPEPVEFKTLGVTSVESGRTYRMVVEHPNLEKSFDELLAIAREYYTNYPSHTESSYYDAARIAYDNAINHNECPLDTRASIRAERDTIASIRKNLYLIEAANDKAKKFEKEKGFECDEVYRYLGGVVRFTNRLLQYHPEITGVQDIKNEAVQKSQQHPRGKTEDGTTTVIKYRQTITGKVTFKNEYMTIPFNKMNVYAVSSSKIKDSQSRVIGRVAEDGTFSVVRPDGMNELYIYVTGEKDNAHYVAADTTVLNIVVK